MKMILRQEKVNCGKDCDECPHGPYWYGYLRPGTKLMKVYFGKQHPSGNAVAEAERNLRRVDDAAMKKKFLQRKLAKINRGVKSVHKSVTPPSPSIGKVRTLQQCNSSLDKKVLARKVTKKTR